MSIWDDPGMKVGGNYAKFENVGDEVSGKVINIGAHRWDDGSVSPQITLETPNGEVTVTAGQVRLKAALAEKRPETGDFLTIALTQIEKRAGGKTLKHFDVTVDKGEPWGKSGALSSASASSNANLEDVDPAVLAALKKQLGATPF